ncbi:hypothetical protein D3C83_184710 [compost metagenome]
MEPVRADIEVKIAVVPASGQPADHIVALHDRDVVALARELVSNGQASDAGTDDRD